MSDLDESNVTYRRLRRFLSPLVDRFICVSRDLAQWLETDVGIKPGKIRQIYNGVDHERFSAVAADPSLAPAGFLGHDSFVVGTVGRLAAVKDQATLLCAVEHILEQRPALGGRLRVIVVGDGPLRRELEEQAQGIDARVWFAGDRKDVPALMTLMDVFVLPSLGEGVSNTVLEAMSCGRPVVASDVGGNPELVAPGETGYLFPVGDAACLAEQIFELFDAPRRATEYGLAGQRRVRERHDWDNTVTQYLSVYDEILGQGK